MFNPVSELLNLRNLFENGDNSLRIFEPPVWWGEYWRVQKMSVNDNSMDSDISEPTSSLRFSFRKIRIGTGSFNTAFRKYWEDVNV